MISINKMASSSNFRMSLRCHVMYTHATFSRTKAPAKWSVTATKLSRVTSCIQIRAQLKLFQVKVMFKQHMNLMIWTWILRLRTAWWNDFPCKNLDLIPSWNRFKYFSSTPMVPYFCVDWTWNNFFSHSFSSFRREGLLSFTSETESTCMCTKYWLTAQSSLTRNKCG